MNIRLLLKVGGTSESTGEDALNREGFGGGIGWDVCIMVKGGLNVTHFVSEINLSGHFPNSLNFELNWTEIDQGHRSSLNDCFVNAVILSTWVI